MNPQEYLNSFINHEIHSRPVDPNQFKLERVFRLLQLIGNPHQQLKCIHVAGTKGKGSTCAMVAAVLQRAGYRVGLYTSPHLYDYKERIRILDPFTQRENKVNLFSGQISDEEVAAVLHQIKPAVEAVRDDETLGQLSYFEVLTVTAIYYFQQRKVDFAVFETGLGGRLDATNVLDALVSVITPVSLEHTRMLGSTVEAIAVEKAQIIKPTTKKAVIAPQYAKALKVIKKRCQTVKVPFVSLDDIGLKLIQAKEDFWTFEVSGFQRRYPPIQSPLLGEHQMVNAAVAIAVAESLQEMSLRLDVAIIAEGLERTFWPGRFEIIQHSPLVVLDCAHNPASMETLVRTTRRVFPNKRVILVLGVSVDKDIRGICQHLKGFAQTIILTQSSHPRAYIFSRETSELLFGQREVFLAKNVYGALEIARGKSDEDSLILVTGSVFLVAEAREYLRPLEGASIRTVV